MELVVELRSIETNFQMKLVSEKKRHLTGRVTTMKIKGYQYELRHLYVSLSHPSITIITSHFR